MPLHDVLPALTDFLVQWTRTHLLAWTALAQAVAVAACCVAGWALARPLVAQMQVRFPGGPGPVARVARALAQVLPWATGMVLVLGARAAFAGAGLPGAGLKAAGTILLAYVLVRFLGSVMLSRLWGRLAAVVALVAVALETAGVLSPVLAWLDGFGLDLGGARMTVLTLAKAGVVLAVLMRLGAWASELVERRMQGVTEMTPSMRVLLGKVVRVALFVLAFMIALGSVGVDLTALTVFSGAVGVGLGFGLQKVFSNLVSGFILLLDKSIKPGDVIEVGGVYGAIKELRARFVSVVTRDGTEYLIPNEDLITGQVVNWSFSDNNVRLRLPVGVSYNTPDVRRVLALMAEAAAGVPRVLASPKPRALFRGFGDSALDLELRFWVGDPENGVGNVRSEVGLAVLDALRAAGVEIPFPQRDLHLVSGFAPGGAGAAAAPQGPPERSRGGDDPA
ncbi:mechanosensitive ion channel family protein [Desulfocurvus vexinensis]|uniref:mechanosensitive ion channel family protein n=1 Tax=Desulfocurvus vexinensis TaxID=399548 RepID=UPI0004B8B001|nr:mechanosensitive ion channel domain-containing protein [Desulfocurvus vexinensis]